MTSNPSMPPVPGREPASGAPRPDTSWAVPENPYGAPPATFVPPGITTGKPPESRGRGSSLLTAALVGAALVAALGVGFAAGRTTAPTTSGRGTFGNGQGAFPNASGRVSGAGGFGGLAGALSVTGSVVAIGNGTLTVQEASGGQVTISVPSSTTYHTQAPGSSSDVTIGTNVTMTVSRPQFRGPDASGAPAGGPAASGGPGRLNLTATDVLVLGK